LKIKKELLSEVDCVICYAGLLAGDLWMGVPHLVEFCIDNKVGIVIGTYTKEIWDFLLSHIDGLENVKVLGVLHDPDLKIHEFSPMRGFSSLYATYEATCAALRKIRSRAKVIFFEKLGNAYGSKFEPLSMSKCPTENGNHVVVHGFTRHTWKNCDDVVLRASYKSPTVHVGISGEPKVKGMSYTEKMFATVRSKGICGVLSSFNCIATVFHKPAVVASFTPDCKWVTRVNPNAHTLVCPSLPELQEKIDELGW